MRLRCCARLRRLLRLRLERSRFGVGIRTEGVAKSWDSEREEENNHRYEVEGGARGLCAILHWILAIGQNVARVQLANDNM